MAKQRNAQGSDELQERVKWLLKECYGGSRSKMATEIKVSLTGLISVVTGVQQPGRRLIEKLIANAGVRPAWLMTGEGQPFSSALIPVTNTCLPGAPDAVLSQLSTDGVPELTELYTASRYWLRLTKSEAAVKASGSGLREGDLLLMETARSTFPQIEDLSYRWGVVRIPPKKPVVRLAQLTYTPGSDKDEPLLEADTFDHHPKRTAQRYVIDDFHDGRLEVTTHKVHLQATPLGKAQEGTRTRWSSSILPEHVAFEDVVALCILLVRRMEGSDPTSRGAD